VTAGVSAGLANKGRGGLRVPAKKGTLVKTKGIGGKRGGKPARERGGNREKRERKKTDPVGGNTDSEKKGGKMVGNVELYGGR